MSQQEGICGEGDSRETRSLGKGREFKGIESRLSGKTSHTLACRLETGGGGGTHWFLTIMSSYPVRKKGGGRLG